MGAYDFKFYKVGMVGDGGRKTAAILAIKTELVYNGYGEGIDFSVDKFGAKVEAAVKLLQKDRGLNQDGICGPTTMRELFRKRVEFVEDKYNLPRGSLGRKIFLESGYDPVAIGVRDGRDRGICQINLKELGGFHNVTIEQAYTPSFSIDWAGAYVRGLFAGIAHRADVMKAARAAYNVGETYATEWMLAGFPASGRIVGDIDWFKRATEYLALVDKQVW